MKYLLIIMLFLAVAGCETLGIKVEKVCSGPDKEGYLTCTTSYTDHPACIGSCKKS